MHMKDQTISWFVVAYRQRFDRLSEFSAWANIGKPLWDIEWNFHELRTVFVAVGK